MTRSFTLVPSPLLGPSSMRPLAESLRNVADVAIADLAIADLTRLVEDSDASWESLASRVVDTASQLAPPVIVVGHSGAGVLLPLAAAQLGPETTLVFVDAVVPQEGPFHRTPPDLAELLDANTDDGRLTSWLEWWPVDTVNMLLADPAVRRELLSDMPRVRRSLYDEPVPVPNGWADRRCGYVRLSAPYDADLATARGRNWPCEALDADHLSLVTRPAPVAGAIGAVLAGSG